MKTHAWILVILSILLGIASGMFSVPDYDEVIKHPQFGDLQPINEIVQKIVSTSSNPWRTNGLWWYKCFFFLDFIWAACLLSYLYRSVRDSTDWLRENPLKEKCLPRLLLIAVIAAYFSDVCENIMYLRCLDSQNCKYFSGIVDFKVFAYAIVFLLVVIFLYQTHVYDHLSKIRRSLRATFLSIIAILLLAGLATLMEQGSTVIIHLLENSWSLSGAIILINLLALASAHYPDYLDKYFSAEIKCASDTPCPNSPIVKWEISGLFGKNPFWGIGVITYKDLTSKTPSVNTTNETNRQLGDAESKFFGHFRKIIGLLILVTWMYVLLYVIAKYKYLTLPLQSTTILILTCVILFYFHCARVREEWRDYSSGKFKNKENPDDNDKEVINERASTHESIQRKVRLYLNATLTLFIIVLLATGVTIWMARQGNWTHTWTALMITSLLNIMFIVLFQHFRTAFSMVDLPNYSRWVPIYHLKDDIRYVRFFAVMGFICLLVFIGGTFQPAKINALVFILLFTYLAYGFVVVLMKHHLYYRESMTNLLIEVPSQIAKTFFEKYVPILGLVLIVWILYTGSAGNGLHVLHPVKEEGTQLVSIDTFKNKIKTLSIDPGKDTMYFVSSYGGGLRATAWTMLLLEELQKHPRFPEKTIAMSGVSGGFLGLSFYTSILAEDTAAQVRKAKIDMIGKHNILSIDIAYLLGFDFVREMFPYIDSFCFDDRAGRSMQEYATLIHPKQDERKKLLETSYRQYWGNAFLNPKNKFIPALIGNSTGTHSRYGVAFSINNNKQDSALPFDSIFPGAVDILELEGDHSITYLDATSTVERFPIFSPTAQIKGKGHFLDGGYFENSGLLSLISFYEYLRKDASLNITDTTTKIIVFINSKDAYIRKVLGDSVIVKNELATGEMGAILSTVADIDILPLALEDKYKQQFGKNFIPVYLPYPITYDDVVALIRGTPAEPLKIQDLINASNKKISDLIGPYKDKNLFPVPPALARVLSDPAYEYMKAMLQHEEVKETIARIN